MRDICFSVVHQAFKANVDHESYAIVGNDVLVNCDLPSFVSDMVTVTSWHDSKGNEYHAGNEGNDIVAKILST